MKNQTDKYISELKKMKKQKDRAIIASIISATISLIFTSAVVALILYLIFK